MSVELIPQWWRRAFAWFANRQLRKAKATFRCPSCAATIPARVHADLLWEEVTRCPECLAYAPVSTYLKEQRETEEMNFAEAAEFVEQPLSTRIVAKSTANGRRWEVPAKGGWNFLLAFASMWLAFSLFVSVFWIMKWREDPKVEPMTFVPLLFPLVGVVIFYFGLRASQARHTLQVSSREVEYTRHFLGFTKRIVLQRAEIRSAQLVLSHTEDNHAISAIEVKAERGKIVFGSVLTPQEKAWLCQEVRLALGLASVNDPPPVPKIFSEWRSGRLEMERGADHAVVRSQSRGVGTIVLIVGAFFVGVTTFMLAGGTSMWMDWEPEAGAFYFIFNGFILFWCAGVGTGLLIGLAMLRFGWIARNTTKMLHADASAVTFIATCGRRVVKHTWAPADVLRMCVESNMRVNEVPVYHGTLQLPDRIVTFGAGAPKEEVQRALHLLSDAMGKTELTRSN